MLYYDAVRTDIMIIRLLRSGFIYTPHDSAGVLRNSNDSLWDELRCDTWQQWKAIVENEIGEYLLSGATQSYFVTHLQQVAEELLIDKIYFRRLSATPRAAWFALLYICVNCIADDESARGELLRESMLIEEAYAALEEINAASGINKYKDNRTLHFDDSTISVHQESTGLGHGLELKNNNSDSDKLDILFSYCNCITPPHEKINTSPLTGRELIGEIMRHIDDAPVSLKRKRNYIAELNNRWQRNYNEFLTDFDWIDAKDDDQVIYLWTYLKNKNFIPPYFEPFDGEMRYQMLISCLDNWSPLVIGDKQDFISKMSRAWSQKKSSEKKSKEKVKSK
ncbi:hypothetical protein PGS62_19490 [Yersinia rochesterensis]|uniref:hypothetical protein n=1 Tax=Yersinia TaxID=629 RepID=UPI0022401DD7|nr:MULTISPECIES: hypothetical protein [Yersinia]MDA5546104.1 hypothetical protein [Yersinia rochesterensis]UZM75452.1 hypothetical protein OP863_01790 [Yersinia sp. SCPM-O-B-9106 (C-191)]